MKGRRISINNDIKKKLTVSPYNPSSPILVTYKMYKLTNKFMYIPRYYCEEGQIITNDIFNCDISINCNPRDYQLNVINDIINEIKENGSCIACLYTGWGKTFASLYIASVLKVKTLIIVNKESLLKQWTDEIKKFLNIDAGIIQGKNVNTNSSICLGMIQSISQKDYDKDIFNEFSFCIFDETHHYCSKVFSEVFFKIGAVYNLGLTATIKRADKLEYTLNWFLGKIAVNVNLLLLEPTIYIYNFYDYENNTIKLLPNGKVSTAASITNITLNNSRNLFLFEIIKNLYSSNRNILILTDRKNHCDYINNALISFDYNSGVYYGGMKNEDLKKTNNCKIIIATYQMASEGYDNPKLDTLILASPKCNIEQAVGRILRKKNENQPLVIDINDNISIFNNWNRHRYNFYLEKQFNLVTNNNGSDVLEEEIFNKIDFRND